jgi:hypothetical protein
MSDKQSILCIILFFSALLIYDHFEPDYVDPREVVECW